MNGFVIPALGVIICAVLFLRSFIASRKYWKDEHKPAPASAWSVALLVSGGFLVGFSATPSVFSIGALAFGIGFIIYGVIAASD